MFAEFLAVFAKRRVVGGRWRLWRAVRVETAQPRSRLGPGPRAKSPPPGKAPQPACQRARLSRSARFRNRALMLSSTLGGRVHIPTRFVGVGPCGARRQQASRRVVPGPKMSEDFLDHPWAINHRENAHRVLEDGTAQRVSMPNAQDQVAPPLGRELKRRPWGNARAAGWACGAGRFSASDQSPPGSGRVPG